MRRPLTSLVASSALFCAAVVPVHAQDFDDRAFVVNSLKAKLASLVPGGCDRSLVDATGKTLGWANEADRAGQRKDIAYAEMMAAPLGYGLVDHYAAQMDQAMQDQRNAVAQAKTALKDVSAARAQTIACIAAIPHLRADVQAILDDPIKLDQAVDQFRLTRQAMRTAVTSLANEAQGVGSGLLDGSPQGERVDRLQQKWAYLQPRLAPEYVPPSQTALLQSLVGAVVEAERAVRFVQSSEGQMAALSADLAAQQRRLGANPSLMDRGWVEQQAHNLNNARRDLAIARRTLDGSRKSLAQVLAETAKFSESSP